MSDGVLAYFGHADDVERAIRAGFSLVEAAPKLATSDAAGAKELATPEAANG
jgi:hypothetical protein